MRLYKERKNSMPITMSWAGLRSRMGLWFQQAAGSLEMAAPQRPVIKVRAQMMAMFAWRRRKGRVAIVLTLLPTAQIEVEK